MFFTEENRETGGKSDAEPGGWCELGNLVSACRWAGVQQRGLKHDGLTVSDDLET